MASRSSLRLGSPESQVSAAATRDKNKPSIQSSFSASHYHAVVSKFGMAERKLLCRYKLDKLLEIPPHKEHKRQFTVFVLSRIDEHTGVMDDGHGNSVLMTCEDAVTILGIPSGPIDLAEAPDVEGVATTTLTVESARDNLERLIGKEKNKDDEKVFIQSFLAFCFGKTHMFNKVLAFFLFF